MNKINRKATQNRKYAVLVVKDRKKGILSFTLFLKYRYPHKQGVSAVGRDWEEIKKVIPKCWRPMVDIVRHWIKNKYKPAAMNRLEKRWFIVLE